MKTKGKLLETSKKIDYKKVAFYSIFIFIVITMRIIFLDADIPSSASLTHLYPIDEGFYVQSSLNLYNYGTFTSNILPYISGDSGIANLFQTVLTYFSLLLFGNTYYGIRMPSVIVSLITIFLFYLTIKKINNKKINNKKILVLFSLIYLITDFEYLLISRVFITTGFRVFFMIIIIYMFSEYYHNKLIIISQKKIIILSFLSMSSIFFVSFYNIFIYSATVFTIFLTSLSNNWKTNKKQINKDILFIIIGTAIALIFFLLYLKIIYDKTFIEYIQNILELDDRTKLIFKLKDKNIILAIANKVFKPVYLLLTISIFKFNISFLFLFLFFLPIHIYKTIKYKNIFNIFITNLFLFLYIQTIFESTYSHRRLVVLVPLSLIIIFNNLKLFHKINYKSLKSKILLKYYSIILILFPVTFTFIKILILKFNHLSVNKYYNQNFSLSFIILLIISYIALLTLFFNKKLKNLSILLSFLIIPNIFMLFNDVYLSPQFHYRNSMIELSKVINNKIIPGQLSFSFRLYNTSKPVLNMYKYFYNEGQYAKNLGRAFQDGHNQIIQFAYKKNQYFTITDNKTMKLKVNEVFYIGRGKFIVLYDVL